MAATAFRTEWANELTVLARATTGGMLVGVPLLFTMEMWWSGQRTAPSRTALVLAGVMVVLFVLHRTAGFRTTRDVHLADAAADSAVSLALGLVLSGAVLVLLREIDMATPVWIAVNKAAYQAIPFALGAGVARYVLTDSRDDREQDRDVGTGTDDDNDDGPVSATVADIGASAIGAVLLGMAIAPTDEIPMLDSAIEGPWLVALVLASLAISYAIVFVAGFSGETERKAQHGWFQHPVSETVMCYLVALACALALLWMFHRLGSTPYQALTHAVVLGLPMAIGAAAGRLAV
jgi:putative integral membrane protein (TIGR02587 family)